MDTSNRGIIEPNDNANDQWEGKVGDQTLTGQVVERISKNNLNYVTKADCRHEQVERRETDEFDAPMIEVRCLNCPLGFFEPKATS